MYQDIDNLNMCTKIWNIIVISEVQQSTIFFKMVWEANLDI